MNKQIESLQTQLESLKIGFSVEKQTPSQRAEQLPDKGNYVLTCKTCKRTWILPVKGSQVHLDSLITLFNHQLSHQTT